MTHSFLLFFFSFYAKQYHIHNNAALSQQSRGYIYKKYDINKVYETFIDYYCVTCVFDCQLEEEKCIVNIHKREIYDQLQ